MNVGAEPKKIAVLSFLALVGGYVFYANVFSSSEPRTTVAKAPGKPGPSGQIPAPQPNIRRTRTTVRGAGTQSFKPTLKRRPEDQPNYATIDPTLRVDLLAKVQSVGQEGGARSLFQFAAAPAAQKPVQVAVIHPEPRMYGPQPLPPPAPPAPPPAPPPPPPITLKFYGFAKPRPDGHKRAFFMDGDEIFVAEEGELVKKRYRVVQIDATSVIMEDTQYKNNRQTLPLTPEFPG